MNGRWGVVLAFALPLWGGQAAAQVQTAQAQKVTKIEITFNTTGDDKDGNTQVLDRIVINGQDYATLECCSSGNHGSDVWQHGSSNTRAMSIVKPIMKNELRSAQVVFGMRPNGHDKWQFTPTLKVSYDQGPPDQWTFDDFYLESNHTYTSRTFGIPH